MPTLCFVCSPVRRLLMGLLLSLPAMAAPPTVQRAFETADLASCLPLAPHPEEPLRVTFVSYADGAWAVAPGDFEDAPPEALQGCLSETVRAALEGVSRPRRELVLERTLWPSTSLAERFEQSRAEIADCVLVRLKTDRLVARLRLSTNAKGVLTVETNAGKDLVGCVKKHLVSLRPAVDAANVELEVERPGAPPRHDGTAGAVCQWAEPGGLPRPRACRAGLVCRACSGGAQQLVPEPVDSLCVDAVTGCPAVP